MKDSLDDVQLEEDLKILLRPFANGTKVLKADKYATDEEKLSSWFRARFSSKPTVVLAGTASKIIMTPEFAEDMKEQGMQPPQERENQLTDENICYFKKYEICGCLAHEQVVCQSWGSRGGGGRPPRTDDLASCMRRRRRFL